ncbi:class I SAM-dependent methyltransferase [Candidatus Thioglobus sp.]|nr:class I SAM-dependent methyltransferase [Candidatus Thioglobus sp.]
MIDIKSAFSKLYSIYKNLGIIHVILRVLNWFLSRTFGIYIIKQQNISSSKIAKKIFASCSLKKSDNGYWLLNPMPSEDELSKYYGSLYWDSRNGKSNGINTRDLVHFDILKQYVPDFIKGNCFLNFGAGHGGISHLAWLTGLDIINVEPSGVSDYYNERWKTYSAINNVPDNCIDVLYGSHSLEHVHNLEKFILEIKRILKPNGIMFWEVPNAECETNGAMKGKVDIPHTYYFTTNFFDNLFDDIIFNKGFEQSQRFNVIENWADFENAKGPVIRAIGRFNS